MKHRQAVPPALVLLLITGCFSQTATPTASPSPFVYATPAGRSDGQWTTFMGDPMRTGIGPSAPLTTNPHRVWSAPVDGDVYASPLAIGSTVIAATERNSVYALDTATGAVRWRTALGTPVPISKLECGNIDLNGVTSTPVADPSTGLVYVVAMLDAPVRHELFALRLADGGIAWHRPVDAPNADPGHHQQRGALNLAAGHVYFTYGGFTGDCGSYHGRVVRVASDGTGPLDVWQVPSQNEGGIWSPAGPVIDSAGNVWVSTGNTEQIDAGAVDNDWSNAVVRLDTALGAPADSWWPSNWLALNQDDIDLASLSPALLPGDLVFIAGKEGVGYLLRAGHLGGNHGEVYRGIVCHGGPIAGAFGGAAVAGGMVFVPCKDGLAGLRINASAPSFTVVWHAAIGTNSPVVAYGLVWTVAADPYGYRQAWTGDLVGVDPVSGSVRARVHLGDLPHFPSPAAAGGNLYVGGRGTIYAVAVA
jgi:outer membrane protein assembly factor BamB